MQYAIREHLFGAALLYLTNHLKEIVIAPLHAQNKPSVMESYLAVSIAQHTHTCALINVRIHIGASLMVQYQAYSAIMHYET